MTRNATDAPNQQYPVRYVRADVLSEDDIITDGSGVYRVLSVHVYPTRAGALTEYVHISVTTIAGAVRGGLMRSPNEAVATFATVARDPSVGVEGTPRRD